MNRHAHFTALSRVADLDDLFSPSREVPSILFLHDRGCPISLWAYQQVAQVDAQITLVDVGRAHDVSRAIEDRTGLRHASPQVIVLHDGVVVWSASHGAITTAALAHAVGQQDPGAAPS